MLDHKVRYLQIAFNDDLATALRLLPGIPASPRILIEAGTPFLKREGLAGLRGLRRLWKGQLVADLKTSDGGEKEVELAWSGGATAITALGSSPTETLDLFIAACHRREVLAMIDMLGVQDPLAVLRPLRTPPDVVVLHRGRDEEQTAGKIIQYRHVNRIRSKYDVVISAAGGVDLGEARSAIFNGASIVVVNIVQPGDIWNGISSDQPIGQIAQQFLNTIE
jgi:bifunctional enzyme Fae/Hps